jgi:RNA polymerase sigma-54 factor
MVLAPRLDLRQSQTLVMTPQLQQAIKLLQMSNLELNDFVSQELESNPLLEREDTGDELPFGEKEEPRSLSDEDNRSEDLIMVDAMPGEGDSPLDISAEDVWNHDSVADSYSGDGLGASFSGSGGRLDFEDEEGNFEQILANPRNLREHLEEQINVDILEAKARFIAFQLLELLEETGWLTADLTELATRLECPLTEIEAVLARMQRFDPPGVFARSLKECLALQLREKNRLDPAMQLFLENLDLLAKREMAKLIKICGVDAEDISDMLAEIRALDPKPALAFETVTTHGVIPDVIMRAQPGGIYTVELNADTLPRVLINQRYLALVSASSKGKETRQFLSDRLQSANWLVKALHQRATTILKVASELVIRQHMFFAKGVQYLKPLILRDIAEAISMHESTVSRVTSNKYIATPRGIFELKYFFTQAINASGGEDAHSAESVRHRIKALIDAEKPGDILSDDTIVELLTKEKVEIARRTVAKYREAMGIGSSVQRRREKGMARGG